MAHNYLNNKDILKEIHKSKNTFCWFQSVEDSDYDIIIELDENGEIRDEHRQEGRENRAVRLSKLAHEAASKNGVKQKLSDFYIDPQSINPEDVVYRVIAWDHIPLAPVKPVDPKTTKKKQIIEEDFDSENEDEIISIIPTKSTIKSKHVKINFPPFQHWKIIDGKYVIVGISHWKGDKNTGQYCRDHGNMTNNLVLMIMKLTERYSTKAGWRNYSYLDEMRSQSLLQLVQVALQFDEYKSANPFSYYTQILSNSFTRIYNEEKKNQVIRDDLMELNDLNPSYTRQANSGHLIDYGND